MQNNPTPPKKSFVILPEQPPTLPPSPYLSAEKQETFRQHFSEAYTSFLNHLKIMSIEYPKGNYDGDDGNALFTIMGTLSFLALRRQNKKNADHLSMVMRFSALLGVVYMGAMTKLSIQQHLISIKFFRNVLDTYENLLKSLASSTNEDKN